MIVFFYETNFGIEKESEWKKWIEEVVAEYGFRPKEINYIFSDDEYLLGINQDFLSHDYYTDVISFQYTKGVELVGDVYISVERVRDNAEKRSIAFEEELARVMVHGVLHFVGFKDKTESEKMEMRMAEDKWLSVFKEIK